MNEKPPDIDSLTHPLAAMMQQYLWAFQNSIRFKGTPDGERARDTYEFYKREIKKHLEDDQAF